MNAELDTTFVKVCDLEDLAVGTPALADVDGIPMALVRTAPDEVHAVNDVCTHANVSLSEGVSPVALVEGAVYVSTVPAASTEEHPS